jgi:DNA-binding CsgD family transcriptional regulator
VNEFDDARSEAWTRFWRFFTAEKLARCSGFAGALRYFKMCVASTAIDRQRRSLDECTFEFTDLPDGEPPLEMVIAERAASDDLWCLVHTHAMGEAEHAVLDLSYREGLRPREIAALRPHLFENVHTVYDTKRRLLHRLRRNRRLHALVRAMQDDES